MKQLFKKLLIIHLFLLSTITTDGYADGITENGTIADIVFPDKMLSECIETEAFKNGWEFSDDVRSVGCARILNPNGLDHLDMFRKIKNIHISGGKIEDLSPLKNLISIESAILSSNAISDLSALSGLANLKILNLGNNEISDIRPLSGLAGIEVLELYSNHISDISALAELKNLRILSLYDNKIKDIKALYGLEHLVFLDLAGNPDLSISQINELKKQRPDINLRMPVQMMDQRSGEGVNFNFKSKPLGAPDLPDQFVPDLDFNKLIQAYARYNNLEDQRKVIIRTKDIKDFEGLERLSGLTELEIAYSGLENTYALRGLTNLKKVQLHDNHITNLEGLANLKNLTSVKCWGNDIVDITPLKYLNNLEYLSLSDNQISDISALAGLNHLKRLYLSQNRISDINPLLRIPNLKFVELSKNENIKCSDLERLKQSLPDTRIIFPDNCAEDNIEDVRSRFIKDLKALKIYHKAGVAKAECYSEDDGQLYRTTFTSGVKAREPVDVLKALPSRQKKVFFFTEIIGAKGRTITHQWYYNDTHMADVPFAIKGDRWRTWSSKNIGTNTSGVWQVKVVAENGCLLGHESIRISDSLVALNKDSGGFFKPGDAITVLIKKGDAASVLKFCDRDFIERRNKDGETPLMEAINAGEVEIVNELLEKGASVFARDLSGKSAIDLAANTNNRELVGIIHRALKRSPPWAVSRAVVTTTIENKEPLNCVLSCTGPSTKDVRLFTELMDMEGRAVVHRWMMGNEVILSSTFKIKKNIEQCFSTFKISEAFFNKRIHVVVVDEEDRQLFRTDFNIYDTGKRAHIVSINSKGIDNSAIHSLFKEAGSIKKIEYLVDKAKKSNSWAALARRKYLLEAIIRSRSITHLRYYLNQGADIDYQKALNMALEAGQEPMALYLKKRCIALERSNPARVKKTGTNPILTAVIHNNGFMVKALLRLGEDPNYTYRGNANALIMAISTDYVDDRIVHDLLAYGANPNTISNNTNKDTALMLAVKHCKLEIMKLLLAYGADPYMKNKKGINTMDLLNKCTLSQQRDVMFDFIKDNP